MMNRHFYKMQDIDGQTVELESSQFASLIEQIKNIKMPTLGTLVGRIVKRFILPLALVVVGCICCFSYKGNNVILIDGCNCLKQIFLCIILLIFGVCAYLIRLEWISVRDFNSLTWDGTPDILISNIKAAESYLSGATITQDNPTKLIHIAQTTYLDYKIFKTYTSDGLLCHEAIAPDGKILETPHMFIRDISSESLLIETTARNKRMVYDIIDSDIEERKN